MKNATSLFGAAAAFGLALMSGLGPCLAEAVTLRYSNWLPATYAVNTEILYPWIEQVKEATEGRVVIEPTPKAVGNAAGQFDVVAEGLADIALIVPAYTPGRFPLIEGFEMPFLGDDATTRAPSTWKIYEKHVAPLDIFKGVRVLSLFSSNSAQIYTTSKDLTTLQSFSGAKLRSPSPTTNQVIELLGGVPINKPAPETYELASGGIIDGAIVPPESMTGFKLEDVLRKMTYLKGGVANTVLVWGINPQKWESISEQDRTAILAISGEAMAQFAGNAHQKFADEAMDILRGKGVVVVEPDPSALTEIVKATEPVRTAWIERAKAAGLVDPNAMLVDLATDISARDAMKR